PVRGERSAERRTISVVALVTRDGPRLARRGARPAGRARLSALHRGDFGPGGRASFSGIASGSVQRAPRSQVVMPGGRGPEPPGAVVSEPLPQDATPRSAFGSSPETAPQMSGDG